MTSEVVAIALRVCCHCETTDHNDRTDAILRNHWNSIGTRGDEMVFVSATNVPKCLDGSWLWTLRCGFAKWVKFATGWLAEGNASLNVS